MVGAGGSIEPIKGRFLRACISVWVALLHTVAAGPLHNSLTQA